MPSRRAVLAAGAAVAGATSALAANPASAALPYTSASPLRVVTLGDSIMSGPGMPTPGVSRDYYGPRDELHRLLSTAQIPHVIKDESIVGARVDTFLPTAAGIVARDTPDVVIVALGTNDAQNDTAYNNFYNGEARYKQLISTLVGAKPGLPIIATWIQPSTSATLAARQQQINDWIYMTVFGAWAPLGSSFMPPYVGACRWLDIPKSLLGPDGIHPAPGLGVDMEGWLMYRQISNWLALPAS